MVLRTRSRRAATSFLVRPLVSMVSWRWTVTVAGQSINTKGDRKSTRLNSSHTVISYAVFCLKTKNHNHELQSNSDLLCSHPVEKTTYLSKGNRDPQAIASRWWLTVQSTLLDMVSVVQLCALSHVFTFIVVIALQ